MTLIPFANGSVVGALTSESGITAFFLFPPKSSDSGFSLSGSIKIEFCGMKLTHRKSSNNLPPSDSNKHTTLS